MSRVVGIDIRDHHVRAVALRAGYRKLELDGMAEELLASFQTPREAISACLAKLPPGSIDTLVGSLPGTECFVHRLSLPVSAKKRIDELVPFELEAVLPLEVEELLIDSAVLPYLALLNDSGESESSTKESEFSVLAVAAPITRVQEQIDLLKDATSHQPERIGCRPAELGQLCTVVPGLTRSSPLALVDFGFGSVDVCIVENGQVTMIRTFSPGVDRFPEEARACSAQIRQTFDAYATSTGRQVETLVILGEGATMSGLEDYLSAELSVNILPFPDFSLEGLDDNNKARVPQFARAFGSALHARRGKGLNLRQGPLAFEQGYEHLKARAPLSAALVAAVLLSFLFSVWAESRALANEHEALLDSLHQVTQSTFGQGTDDPDEAEVELEKARKIRPDDPMPYIDGFGTAVALAETLPDELTHDVEEFDFAKAKLKLRGKVDSADEAQQVAKRLGEHRCVSDTKVTKITQVVNSEQERYVLEATVGCPEGGAKSEAKKKSGGDE